MRRTKLTHDVFLVRQGDEIKPVKRARCQALRVTFQTHQIEGRTQLALCDASIDLMRHHNIGYLGKLGKLFERSGSLLLSKA
jgi:hypothetical protein